MAPGTEFARDFCAGIGPLQLGVVLVRLFIYFSLGQIVTIENIEKILRTLTFLIKAT